MVKLSMFRIFGDIIKLIKDLIRFILKIAWKLAIAVLIIGAIVFGIKSLLHL